MRAIGLMSGTSMDGVDVALIDTDGEGRISFGPQGSFPYVEADRILLRGALADAVALDDRKARPGRLGAAEAMVTERHASAVERFLAQHDVAQESIDLIGFHGQTVLHRPSDRLTVQIGDGAALARRLGIKVASDFRAEDVAAGGQGAPLVPVYHHALVARDALDGPVVVINIGGVANITYVTQDADPIACDTGPGNALLDDLMLARMGAPFDRDGVTAGQGRVHEEALARLMDHPYFALPAPKSLDRNAFSRAPVDALSIEDAAATLVAFTAETIATALRQMPAPPHTMASRGGGGRNPTLMRELGRRLPCALETADTLGWSIDAMEAQAFAYLAVRQARNLPITFPGTTGIQSPLPGGRLDLP
jgi:anhydro-N-acetylmuramic acid kinase